MNNQEKFDNWKDSIKEYKKLNIKEAQELCIKMNNTSDLDEKKEYKSRIVTGLLHYISKFILDYDLIYLNNKAFDIEDIINSCIEALIKKINSNELLKISSINQIYNGDFINTLYEGLGINTENQITNITNFEEYFADFIIEKRKNPELTYGEFYKHVLNSPLYEHMAYYRYFNKYIENRYRLFNSILNSFDEIDIPKTKLKVIKNILINVGFENLMKNPEDVSIENQEDLMIGRHVYKDIEDFILKGDRLNDREKYVLTRRIELDGHDFELLEDIGKSINVSRDRIRQIEAKALRKIRLNKKIYSYYKEYMM